jgi:hypothetical protein
MSPQLKKGPGPLRPPEPKVPLRPAYEFLLVDVPLDDLSILNDYGREGWRCVAVVGRDVSAFQALCERPGVGPGAG